MPEKTPKIPPYLKSARSLGEASESARAAVSASTEDFNGQYHEAMKASDALDFLTHRTEEIVREGVDYLDEARRLLTEDLKSSPDQINAEIKTIRERRELSLKDEDYDVRAKYIDEVARLLIEKAQLGGKKHTESDRVAWDNKVKALLEEKEMGRLVLKELGWETVRAMLDKPFDPKKHQALKERVWTKIEKDPNIHVDRKLSIKHEVRGAFDLLEALSGRITDTIQLSERSIYGMLGRVLPNAERVAVFNGNIDAVKALPSGSVKLVFADGHVEFYHEQGQDDLPPVVHTRLTAEMPTRILMVHYRTNDDVQELLKDLSDGEYVDGIKRDNGEMILVAGVSGSDSIRVKKGGVSETDLLAHPMKYFSHKLHFTRSGERLPTAKLPS